MKVLTTIDLLALPSLETPPAGHVGFGAKSDGLYQKIGTVETKLSVDGHVHPAVTTTVDGFMSAADKVKLDGIVAGAKTGTVTSVAMTVPTGLSISGSPITTSGTLALSLTSGYSIPTTAKQTNWDAAYTHSQASHAYLPLAGGTMGNTNLVTNLNADLLDGNQGSYYTGYTDTAISVVEIGGRNYFMDISRNSYNGNSIIPVDGFYIANAGSYGGVIFNKAYIEEGVEYVLSFEYKTTDNQGHYTLANPGSATVGLVPGTNVTLNLIQDGVLRKKVIRFTAPTTREISICLLRSDTSGTVYYKENSIKLEKGNKATDWTPAPEDVDASIALVQTNLNTHALNTSNPHSVTKAQVGLSNVLNVASYSKTESDTALALKLNKSVFDDLFEKVEVSTGVYAIEAKYDFYSIGGVSAYGLGTGGSGGGIDISKLQSWAGYTSEMADYYVPASLLVPFYNDYNSHGHTISDVTGLQSALDGKVDDGQVLTNVPAGAKFTDTIYTHPSHTARTSGLYKITVDSLGHVTGATAVVKDDITLLGIPAQDTTYGLATTSASGLMSATDKVKLNGIATGATANTGTVTSVGLSVPTGLSVSGTPITTSGILSISLASGYSIPTTAKQANWDSAYTHSQTTGNPHGVTQSDVGLGNVLNVASYSKTESDTNLTSAIDALEIGGRNYFMDISRNSYNGNSIIPVDGFYIANAGSYGGVIFNKAYIEEGVEYVLSFEYKTTDNQGHYTLANPGSATVGLVPGTNVTLNLIQDGVLRKKVIRFTAPTTREISICLLRSDTSGTVYYKENSIKLEKGNKATDWTPAPEDVEVSIDSKLSLTGGTLTGNLTAPTFIGALSGNATTATTATNLSGGTVSATTGTFSSTLSVTGILTGTDKIIAGTGKGFRNAVYQVGFNPIWSFNNAETYGLGYYQGAHGLAGVTGDAIGFHFGSTAAPKVIIDSSGAVTAPTFIGALSGNASSATKLSSNRTYALTGDVAGSVSNDLTSGFSIATTLANSGVTAGTYRSVTVDAKGRVTAGTNPTTLAGYGITDAVTTNTTQTITAQKTFNDGDAVYGLTAKPSIIVGDGGTTKAGAIRLNGNNEGAYGLLQATGGDVELSHNSGGVFIQHYGTGKVVLATGGGDVGIGTTSPAYKLDVNGTGRFTGALTASVSVTTPKVIFAAAGWSLEQVGTEIQYKYNGVVKQRMLSDGSIVATGEVTAFVAAT